MFKNILPVFILITIASPPAHAQVYFTKNGHIAFYSKTILENISAVNNQVISVLNIQTGEIRFSLLNRAFIFPKAKMQEDFNENFMESNRYPRSEFSGIIAGISEIDFNKDGMWPVNVSGTLSVHGVERKISVPGKIIIKDGKIEASASFSVELKDHHIKIPSIVSNKIAERVEVTVECQYQKK